MVKVRDTSSGTECISECICAVVRDRVVTAPSLRNSGARTPLAQWELGFDPGRDILGICLDWVEKSLANPARQIPRKVYII